MEGFYGQPYSHRERLDMIEFLGRQGCNLYLYAPKNDPLHRSQWREPYPRASVKEFGQLVETGLKHGVTVSAAVSPGLSFHYSDDGDLDRLSAKYRQFADVGIRIFALFLDDIPGQLHHEADRRMYASLAAAHVDLAVRLGGRLAGIPGMRLWFCPTEYCGAVPTPYLEELGNDLPPDVGVFWTGPSVCSETIDGAYIREVAAVLRRKPLIWDNYPVNDALMTAELHVGPYIGRDPGLGDETEGILLNPMIQPEASKIALATAAEYFASPHSYDPRAAWGRAISGVSGGHDAGGLMEFAKANTTSPLTPNTSSTLAEHIFRARRRFGAMDYEGAADELSCLFSNMESTAREVCSISNTVLEAELRPWTADYLFWARLGHNAVRAWRLLQRIAGVETTGGRIRLFLQLQVQLERIRDGLRRGLDLKTAACGGAVAGFAQETYRQISSVLSQQARFGGLAGRLVTLYRRTGVRLRRSRVE